MWILREVLMHFEAKEEVLAALLRPTTTKKGAKHLQKTRFISFVNTLKGNTAPALCGVALTITKGNAVRAPFFILPN